MALQDILEKIKKEAGVSLKKLEDEHRAKAKKLEEEYERKKKAAAEDMELKVKKNTEKIREKAEILAKMEAKNELLKEKRKVINTVFEEAIEAISKSSHYEDILAGLLKKCDLEGDNAEVVPAKGKENETKKALSASGKSYKIAEHATHIKGGFILKGGKMEIDNSFESIIGKELKDELELEIAKVLF
ncbi:MAG: V-type ATP synthase subunit E [Patescibacteria group bacterium]|nr:V-type ATP synthase subunit E [Patescibacteria group bacterium]